MNKKTIILVLIAVIFINTIYWISLITQFVSSHWAKSNFLRSLYLYSGEGGTYIVKNIISLLAITDAVLIAISFMIILLYKKE
ncbi:hypothetical protein ES702_03640 [subsurface metagenome]